MAYPFYQQPMMQQPMQQPMQVQPQIQNSGFIMVRNEMEARNYPVGFGNSVTFKDESAPFVYTKTMGYSQMQPPVFEKYRLVKEEVEETAVAPQTEGLDALKEDIKNIWSEIDALKNTKKKKKEIDDE